MEFLKKFSRTYPEGAEPMKIIKGCGNPPNIKIVEYSMVKRVGDLVIYRRSN